MVWHLSEFLFLFRAGWYSFVYVYNILFIHSSVGRNSSSSHLLAVVADAVVNVGIQIFV